MIVAIVWETPSLGSVGICLESGSALAKVMYTYN